MTEQTATGGVDVHGGLRVTMKYDAVGRVIEARYSADTGVDPVADVEHHLLELSRRVQYLAAWLRQWRMQGGTP